MGLSPISREELVRRLKQADFDGPFTGGKHEFMRKGNLRVTLPNPHRGDIGVPLLSHILKQAGVSREHWSTLSGRRGAIENVRDRGQPSSDVGDPTGQ